MDNFIMECRARKKDDLLRLIQVVFSVQGFRSAKRFRKVRLRKNKNGSHEVDPDGTLTFVLMWGGPNGDELPIDMDPELATETVWRWLETINNKDRAERYEGDASNTKAFRVFTDFWGHVAGKRYAIIAIQPIWGWIGK